MSRIFLAALAVALSPDLTSAAEVPDAIAAPNAVKLLQVHAEGAQIYECQARQDGKLAWQFREPIATLIADGKTVGRHYAGPAWELEDGSAVTAKVSARSPGATPKDIPWLKLAAVTHRGSGKLSAVNLIQRISTKGGAAEGECGAAGSFLSVPYASDYVFLE